MLEHVSHTNTPYYHHSLYKVPGNIRHLIFQSTEFLGPPEIAAVSVGVIAIILLIIVIVLAVMLCRRRESLRLERRLDSRLKRQSS